MKVELLKAYDDVRLLRDADKEVPGDLLKSIDELENRYVKDEVIPYVKFMLKQLLQGYESPISLEIGYDPWTHEVFVEDGTNVKAEPQKYASSSYVSEHDDEMEYVSPKSKPKKSLEEYKADFAKMRTSKLSGYKSPHKAVLLISILNMIGDGRIAINTIYLKDLLIDEFKQNWKYLVPDDFPFNVNICNPYIHLASEPFYHLSSRVESPDVTSSWSLDSIRLAYEYSYLDQDLFELAKDQKARREMIEFLIKIFKLNPLAISNHAVGSGSLTPQQIESLATANELIESEDRSPLEKYLFQFKVMRASNLHGYQSPLKAILIISILDGIGNGSIKANEFYYDNNLLRLYELNWKRYVPIMSPFTMNLNVAYQRIAGEPFCHESESLQANKNRRGVAENEYIYFDSQLYRLAQSLTARKKLIDVLIKRFELLEQKDEGSVASGQDNKLDEQNARCNKKSFKDYLGSTDNSNGTRFQPSSINVFLSTAGGQYISDVCFKFKRTRNLYDITDIDTLEKILEYIEREVDKMPSQAPLYTMRLYVRFVKEMVNKQR